MIVILVPNLATAQLNAVPVGTGFLSPVFAASAPGAANRSTLWVVQQGGLIRTLNTLDGQTHGTPFLDLASISAANLRTGGEQGLLGLAFHPNYESNGLFYVHYKYNNGNAGGAMRVDQFQVNASGVADPSTRRTVIQYDDRGFDNHNAGWIGFNPMNGTTGGNSGHLYIPTGDGGSGNDPDNNAQNLGVYTGKLLRINVGNGLSDPNPNYTNPLGNMTGAGVLPEIFSRGLRNPYRASFDRTTGNLYIGDVGQGAREEVDFIANGSTGGQNFGWRLREGTIQTPGSVGGDPPDGNVEPIHDYDLGTSQSITGGYVYRGTERDDNGNPLDGHYFFADFVQGRIFTIKYTGAFVPDGDRVDRTLELGLTPDSFSPSSFAEDGHGNLYMIDYGGTIYRIVPVPEPTTVGVLVGLAAVVIARRARKSR